MIFLCDFETTGLTKESNDFLVQPGIVQIGAIVLAGESGEGDDVGIYFPAYEEMRALDTLVNPEIGAWEPGAMKTHGITPEKVNDAPTFFAIFDRLAEMAEGCDTWAGYNTKFDKTVLWHQLMRYGFERSFPWPRKELDVMRLASERMSMQGRNGTKNPKLVEIYEHLFPGESFAAHDALADIRATGRVLRELTK